MKKAIKFGLILKFALPLLLLCLMALTGCCDEVKAETTEPTERFVRVYHNHYGDRIMVDTETRVMYYIARESKGCALTVMLDENGKPLLWEGDL